MMALLLSLIPWLVPFAYVAIRLKLPRPLPPMSGALEAAPRVSVIVPARDEALNIEACVESLTASQYPDFEIVVVDDRSRDGTAALARAIPRGRAEGLFVVDGQELPKGWFGKPWACAQGARIASGDMLLFTDADTVHRPTLLGRAVAGLAEDRADAITVVGSQIMESFWERLIQPHVFALLLLRFPDAGRVRSERNWRRAIANGQYLLIKRSVYETIGGHASVAGEVVEDVRLAQELARRGYRLSVRAAEDGLATRMYRSLSDIVEGWSKNLWTASVQTATALVARLVLPMWLLLGLLLWVVPPLTLMFVALATLAFGAAAPPSFIGWAGGATAAGLVFWSAITVRFGAPWPYALLYPLGVLATTLIGLRSWLRGTRIRWKGRSYEADTP